MRNINSITPERNFSEFLDENSEIASHAHERKNAMQVGDYRELPMGFFKRWIETPVSKGNKIKGDIDAVLNQEKESSVENSDIVQVCIVDIEEGGEYIVVEAGGIQKKVHSSLFYEQAPPKLGSFGEEAGSGTGVGAGWDDGEPGRMGI